MNNPKSNMSPNRWEQITDIYTAALELKSSERIDFLNEICAGDEELRLEVESLLEANSEAGDFISAPVIKDIAPLLTIKDDPSLIGQKLAHYRIISSLGAGGMGKVYLAEDTKLGRKVALKMLPPEYCDDANLVQNRSPRRRQSESSEHFHALFGRRSKRMSFHHARICGRENIVGIDSGGRIGCQSLFGLVRFNCRRARSLTRKRDYSPRYKTGKHYDHDRRRAENSRFRTGKASGESRVEE
jgi:hypothetical protein